VETVERVPYVLLPPVKNTLFAPEPQVIVADEALNVIVPPLAIFHCEPVEEELLFKVIVEVPKVRLNVPAVPFVKTVDDMLKLFVFNVPFVNVKVDGAAPEVPKRLVPKVQEPPTPLNVTVLFVKFCVLIVLPVVVAKKFITVAFAVTENDPDDGNVKLP
jgi:hypothetical protein